MIKEPNYNEPAFPLEWEEYRELGPFKSNNKGMTLTDYFAAQYMSAGKLPDEAFRLARLAMKEREAQCQ